MKKGLPLVAFMLLFTGTHAQTNPCTLFFEAFNNAQQGFKDFRPGTEEGKLKYKVDSAVLRKYNILSGDIYIQRHLEVPDQKGKFYTKCSMELNTEYLKASKEWNEIRKELETTFVKQCTQYYDACFKDQLTMSPVTDKEQDPFKLLNIFFYNSGLKIPGGADIKTTLLGNTYIEFSLRKSIVLNAYCMSYLIESAYLEN